MGELTQLLVGIRGSYERDSTRVMRGVGDAVARFYVGSNRAKALMEGQATGRGSVVPAWLLRAGAELEVCQSFWIILSAGWQAAGSAPGRFTIRSSCRSRRRFSKASAESRWCDKLVEKLQVNVANV